ncbi:MAG TPA: MBL fold metallo-hydrolase [Roseiflexaceae bacterium]|nr:MBL fold metallo-hydrolase [Roseiflexaceae bacterium]
MTETHIYADYVSGARELAARTGAQLYLSDMGTADWKYAYAADAGATLLRDGDRFMIGNVRLEVLHTPGHTPEHIAFLVTDTAHADLPMGIASGDFVFVSDVGRPDLRKLGQSTKEVKNELPRRSRYSGYWLCSFNLWLRSPTERYAHHNFQKRAV